MTRTGWKLTKPGEFKLVPDRAEAVRLAVRMFREGNGAVTIMRALEEQGLQITNGGNPAGQLYKIVRNRALVGEKVLEVEGQEYRLPGYYPPLLTAEEFADLQHVAGQRIRRKGTSEIPSLIAGMRVTYCGYCGSAMVAQNLMNRSRRADGQPQHGHRRMICVGNSQGSGCAVSGSCSVVPIEHALMTFCADQMNLTRLHEGGNREASISGQLAVARAAVADTTAKIEK
ncbi:recombinase family protein [Stenotrophomonas sp. NRRL B-14846]|uniref:recombinase family protein n=1 Tax=Stenotrophomonas sp. NRRL B-14846 TaxID=3162882 RepID=UPI003D2BED22